MFTIEFPLVSKCFACSGVALENIIKPFGYEICWTFSWESAGTTHLMLDGMDSMKMEQPY